MKNKILVIGKGFIGNRLEKALPCEITGKYICCLKDVQELINKYKPKVIINCVAYIGRNVDDCEKHRDRTLIANSYLPLVLAEAAVRNNIKLVHISSGCVYKFDYKKDKPIKEEKEPNFFDLFYSRSKIYSEKALEVLARKFDILILRIRLPLDDRPHPRNLLTKLVKYGKIIDTPNSITYIPDFIKALEHLINIEARGIYHIVNKEPLKYPELASAYKKLVPDFKYEVINFKKLNLVRTNLLLSCEKLERTGFRMSKIDEVIKECVEKYAKY